MKDKQTYQITGGAIKVRHRPEPGIRGLRHPRCPAMARAGARECAAGFFEWGLDFFHH